MTLFPSVFTDKNIFVGEYQGNYKWKSRSENKLGKYSLVISVRKYDMSILQTKLPMKTNC